MEQAKALKINNVKIGVIAPIQIGVTQLVCGRPSQNRRFGVECAVEAEIPTLRSFSLAVPMLRRFNRSMWLVQSAKLVNEYTRLYGKPDLIHAHSNIWGGIAANRAAHSLAVPYIVTEHSSLFARSRLPFWQKKEISLVLQRASAVITVSDSLRRLLIDYLPHGQIDVVPNMVDTDLFCLPEVSRKTDLFVFLTVALLNYNKGIHLLLRAFARKFMKVAGVELWIGGDGPQRRYLERLATELRIAGQVRFLGVLSREKVRDYMWQANAFVLPSYYETFGVVVIEAMSTGLPVIGTRCGGPEEIITPQSGRLVPTGDIEGLADAMQLLREEYSCYSADEISRAAAERYGTTAVVDQLMNIYSRIL